MEGLTIGYIVVSLLVMAYLLWDLKCAAADMEVERDRVAKLRREAAELRAKVRELSAYPSLFDQDEPKLEPIRKWGVK